MQFFGFSIASAYASFHLLQEYKLASSLLLSSVEELQSSTAKLSDHLKRIEKVEKDLKQLEANSSGKSDIGSVRGEMKKIYVSDGTITR